MYLMKNHAAMTNRQKGPALWRSHLFRSGQGIQKRVEAIPANLLTAAKSRADSLPALLGGRIIDNEKDHAKSSDSKRIEKLPQCNLYQLLLGPGVLAGESGI